jgi:hypothetical protein
VTAREILQIRPPRYLGWTRASQRPCDLQSLLGNSPAHPDQLKRLTRAGMGPCQGRRCREQVQAILALEAHVSISEVPLASYRAPVRPVPLSVAAPTEALEDPAIRANWDSWFGMPRQWVPYWEAEEEYTVAGLPKDGQHGCE